MILDQNFSLLVKEYKVLSFVILQSLICAILLYFVIVYVVSFFYTFWLFMLCHFLGAGNEIMFVKYSYFMNCSIDQCYLKFKMIRTFLHQWELTNNWLDKLTQKSLFIYYYVIS